ncbi:WD40 repeat-like protein [Aureobasidium subglaciale]|nr:WD40 repeat-like protein [Aureobasidium subglaciale]
MNTTPRGQRHITSQISSSNNSPFARNNASSTPNAPRSPIKTIGRERPELGLSLKRVIGTTCQTVFCFDHLAGTRSFAYTAGAAAVVATVDADGTIEQRFFRANPAQPSQRSNFLPAVSASPADPRHRSPLPPLDRTEWNDSPSGNKNGAVRERVKAATAVSFSPNGRFLAVGETGYKPRVLVFSLAEKSFADSPVASICEHTFGVQSVSFGPDSRYLASLGTVNDGFLYIWAIDERGGAPTLIASNKCTTSVRQMAWMGCSLVTVGLRFIKVWRPNDLPASVNENSERGYGLYNRQHKPLAGRNTLLGDLLDATFTCVAPFSDTKAIVCTDGGDVCILDDEDKGQRLLRVANLDFTVTAVCVGPNSKAVITGLDGSIEILDLNELSKTSVLLDTLPGCRSSQKPSTSGYVAVGSIGNAIVTVDNSRGIQLRNICPKSPNDKPGHAVIQKLPAHSDAVLGVRAIAASNEQDIAFVSWSANGTIIFWSSQCEARAVISVSMDQYVDMYNVMNELKTVVAFSSVSHAVTGDKYGVLRVSNVRTGEDVSRVRAHAGEITDIAIHEDSAYTLIASSSRDRTIQLLTWSSGQLDLLQTLDEHAGSVTCVLFAKNGEQLISCSADRTVVIREAARQPGSGLPLFIITRTITLKNSPTCLRMSLFDDTLLVSATDRTIQFVGTRTGRVLSSFKASDTDGGDAVIMSSLVHLPSTAGSPIVAGVASSDKSVRMYSEDGTLLARDWGHTEGVTDIALLKSHTAPDDLAAMKLVTVAADGTIFIWATVPERPRSRDYSDVAPSFANIAPGIVSAEQPLRKVISHSEIARFQRSRSKETENSEPTPTAMAATASTGLKKKPSRLSIRPPPPRLEPSPLGTLRNGLTVRSRQRSPSPTPPSPSPRLPPSPRTHPRSAPGRHRLSVSAVPPLLASPAAEKASKDGRTEAGMSGFGSIAASTEQLSRMLRAYRQKLDSNCTGLTGEKLRELEKELDSTVQMVQQKMAGQKDEKESQSTSAAEDSSASRATSSSQDASFISARAQLEEETVSGAEATVAP